LASGGCDGAHAEGVQIALDSGLDLARPATVGGGQIMRAPTFQSGRFPGSGAIKRRHRASYLGVNSRGYE